MCWQRSERVPFDPNPAELSTVIPEIDQESTRSKKIAGLARAFCSRIRSISLT